MLMYLSVGRDESESELISAFAAAVPFNVTVVDGDKPVRPIRLSRTEEVASAMAGKCEQCWKSPGKYAFSVCKACHNVSYCSKECQRKHWYIHKAFCSR